MDEMNERSVERRDSYRPTTKTNFFIVTLLHDAIQAFFQNQLPATVSGQKVLDIGCGGQPFRAELEQKGYQYVGFDVVQNQKNNVDILGFVDRDLPESLAHAQFDLIICTEVLEHVADWQQAFKNFQSLLAPGGKMLVTCPFLYNLHEEPHDYWRPTPYALATFAEKYGLRIVDQRQLGDCWAVLGTMIGSIAVKKKGGLGIKRKIVKLLLNWIYKNIKKGNWQKDIEAVGKFYVSNFVVMTKPV